MRELLTAWIGRKFGEIHAQDIFNLKEEVQSDKRGDRIRFITIYLKKYQGIQKDWTRDENFEVWTEELKEIMGQEVLKVDVRAAEASEQRYLGGVVLEGQERKFKEARSKIFSYQINIQILIPMESKI